MRREEEGGGGSRLGTTSSRGDVDAQMMTNRAQDKVVRIGEKDARESFMLCVITAGSTIVLDIEERVQYIVLQKRWQ